jgi:hypothetical protein
LLLADLAQRRGQITQEEKDKVTMQLSAPSRNRGLAALTKKGIEDAYGDASSKLSIQIDLADQTCQYHGYLRSHRG